MDTKNLEGKRQDLAARLVQREVICCVSSLMGGIQLVAHEIGHKQFELAFGMDSDDVQDVYHNAELEG